MNKPYSKLIGTIFLFIILVSCNKDDGGDDYVPLNITTSADVAEVFQNATVDIMVFSNDSNVPSNGSLSVSTPQTGGVTIIDNGTATVLDDVVRYTPNATFTGNDTFQYTICDDTGGSCSTATVTITVLPFSPVVFDITQVPYPKLTDYNFFDGALDNQEPVYGVLPFEPITPLFTDYVHKKRYVWMPNGVKAEYIGDSDLLNFPTGSVLIKNFFYNNVQPANVTQIIETRLLIKKEDGWVLANYIWNEGQNEAFLDATGNGGFVPIQWIENGETKNVNYRIPSSSECFTCHKANFVSAPIGLKPQSLNSHYDYTDGGQNQLAKWVEQGYLESNVPSDIVTVVDWTDTSKSLNLRVRSYLDINCNSCHSDDGHCNYRAPRFSFELTEDPANLGVCVTSDTPIPGLEGANIITPGDPDNSVLLFRLKSIEEQYRMPLLGRTLQHVEGVALIEEWINSLTQICN
ncbi:MAG: cadherin-like domain-containing protein [Flavobacteriaceae bacterium]|nr:cadherin-like domain-containing protein [Flavobacteriaceae bacterium]